MINDHSDQTIVLQFSDIRDLFIAPERDVFAHDEARFTGQSGLERVVRRLGTVSSKSKVPNIKVVLPSEKMVPGLEHKVRSVINRYCTLKIEENERHAKLLRQRGRHALFRGLFFLGICTALAALIRSPLFVFIPDFIQTVLSDGFTIIGWVVLWHPVEAFLYDPATVRQENEIYQFLQRIKVTITAA